jgi:hypothetical protein
MAPESFNLAAPMFMEPLALRRNQLLLADGARGEEEALVCWPTGAPRTLFTFP